MTIFCNMPMCKIIVYIFWNLLQIIIIPVLILGSILGLVGNILILIGPIVYEFLLSSNLSTGLVSSESYKIIDTCLNKDGDLSNFFPDSNSFSSDLDNYFAQSKIVYELINSIIDKNYSPTILAYKDYLDKLYNDVSLDMTNTELSYSGVYLLKSLNDITNYYQNPNLQDEQSCDVGKINDVWVSNKNHCPEGYTYIKNEISNESKNLGSKSCLYISDWSESNIIDTRYSTCPFKDKAFKYIVNLNKYQIDIKESLDNNFYEDIKM